MNARDDYDAWRDARAREACAGEPVPEGFADRVMSEAVEPHRRPTAFGSMPWVRVAALLVAGALFVGRVAGLLATFVAR